jgi:uncharacterized membrane protein YhaH (DUF805 family)
MSIAQILFSFRGRIGVLTYWASTFGVGFVLGFVYAAYQHKTGAHLDLHEFLRLLWLHPEDATTETRVCMSVVLWMLTAIQVKRLHDLGKSGWWALFFCVPIMLLAFAQDFAHASQKNGFYALISLLFSLTSIGASLYSFWISVQMMCFPGGRQRNEFGDAPGQHTTATRVQSRDNGEMPESTIPIRRGVTLAPALPALVEHVATVQPARQPGFGRRY